MFRWEASCLYFHILTLYLPFSFNIFSFFHFLSHLPSFLLSPYFSPDTISRYSQYIHTYIYFTLWKVNYGLIKGESHYKFHLQHHIGPRFVHLYKLHQFQLNILCFISLLRLLSQTQEVSISIDVNLRDVITSVIDTAGSNFPMSPLSQFEFEYLSGFEATLSKNGSSLIFRHSVFFNLGGINFPHPA
jgi:hypothetical protein